MRLIDADAFEEFIRNKCSDSLVDLWCELVRRQPTIDLPGKWIPCSERMPKQGEQIIGTFDNGNGKIIVSQEKFFTQLLKKPYPLVAWMPLPEPYKEE